MSVTWNPNLEEIFFFQHNPTERMDVTSNCTAIPLDFTKMDPEITSQFNSEKSRSVKIFMVKYKCILLFTFLGFAIFEMVYILMDKLSSNTHFTDRMFDFLNMTSRY
jgi:hypothetical protein